MRFSIVQVVLVQGVVLDLSVECFELICLGMVFWIHVRSVGGALCIAGA